MTDTSTQTSQNQDQGAMHKVAIIDKIKKGGYKQAELIKWIQMLPGSSASRKPTRNKKGDVYMHPVFKHPYVLLEKKKGYWLCGLLTTEPECSEILEPCVSRFFGGSYFTRVLFTQIQPVGTYCNIFDNAKQLKSVLIELKATMA